MPAVETRGYSIRFDDSTLLAVYRDTGCSWHPSCLSCPFPVCRYDEPAYEAMRSENRTLLRQRITEMRTDGLTNAEIANRLGISSRTVFRLMADE